jgi:sugar/nucleoside kinase (ribokinase family)
LINHSLFPPFVKGETKRRTFYKGDTMHIYISGSMAYDRIMDFPGKFSDHILPDKIHILNVCFTVNGMIEKFGGTAGNIAYSLSLLKETPLILATIGKDYERYFDWLKDNQISVNGIRIIKEEFTAGAYITTDKADNQITGFNPGSMKYQSDYTFNNIVPEDSIALIAPGNLKDMIDFSKTYKDKGIRYICDPGQSLTGWNKKSLTELPASVLSSTRPAPATHSGPGYLRVLLRDGIWKPPQKWDRSLRHMLLRTTGPRNTGLRMRVS